MIEKALEIVKREYEDDHPKVAICYSNLGFVLKGLEDFSGAEEMFVKALSFAKQTYKKNHPSIAIRSLNLGSVYLDMEDIKLALHYIQTAHEIFENALGADHPNTKGAKKWLDHTQAQLNKNP